MSAKSDVLVIGAGPAGTSAAILSARAGWQVTLVEQHAYPRQKVCGECISAGNYALLDELGIGQSFRQLAGPELEQVGWMRGDHTVIAPMPASSDSKSARRFGRALGRDVFDALLMEAARAVGVDIVQPAKLRRVSGAPGDYHCEIEHLGLQRAISASLIIDAHGSWEGGPEFDGSSHARRAPQRASDLFAFKATYRGSALTPGFLPVVSLGGGYGGLVVANDGRATVALCIRRDALRAIRVKNHGATAGVAVESYLRRSCQGVRDALLEATRDGPWLTVGPLRPGVRLHRTSGVFRVGNAAGECHPLIGEGISMALQSSKLLVESLLIHAGRSLDTTAFGVAHQDYAKAWRRAFLPRMRIAALYAHGAMRTSWAAPVDALLRHGPMLLTTAARFAGKARRAHANV